MSAAGVIAELAQLDARLAARAEWDATTGCINYRGARSGMGYGNVGRNGRTLHSHRLAYMLLRGPVPDGLVLDHLCNNRACMNPDHLQPVTQRENVLRGSSPAPDNAAKTHCPRGHEYDVLNTYVWTNGARRCRPCNTEAQRRRRAKVRAA